jgi:hypothetical protein
MKNNKDFEELFNDLISLEEKKLAEMQDILKLIS